MTGRPYREGMTPRITFSLTEAAAADLAAHARSRGVSEILCGVLTDPAEPPVVRERALGRIGIRLANRPNVDTTLAA